MQAIEAGFMQREIHHAALAWQREVEGGQRTVVGVNRYQIEEEDPELFRPDASARDEVLAGLARVRAERDSARSDAALKKLGEAARGTQNLMPTILEAVEAYATIGEICAVLEEVFGRYHPPEGL